jgi:hypothetical protein
LESKTNSDLVYIVSGLPRAGTSMAMALLQAGGIDLVVDGMRAADEDNLGGYFEYEAVKGIRDDVSWIYAARGKGVKVVSPSLRYLPRDLRYRVVFMRRDLKEVAASQEQMLRRLGKDVGASRAQMIDLMQRHLQEVESWLARSEHVEVLFLPYRDVVEDPLSACRRLIDFLSLSANPLEMAQVVEKKYYRQRADAN